MNHYLVATDYIMKELALLKPKFVEKYGVKNIALFCSGARGTPKDESDIDVVDEMIEPDLLALVHIKEEL